MSFDERKFSKAKLEPRFAFVPVPDLKMFFKEDSEPRWKVRGLSGIELGKVNEAAKKNEAVSAILSGLLSPAAPDKVEALKKAIGINDDVPYDVVRRIEMLAIGSVDPEVSRETIVRLCENFPVEFMELTNMITKITGKGAEIKLQAPSLFKDPAIRESLALCYEKKTYLYQVRRDLMPYDYLSDLEIELWGMFYEELKNKTAK